MSNTVMLAPAKGGDHVHRGVVGVRHPVVHVVGGRTLIVAGSWLGIVTSGLNKSTNDFGNVVHDTDLDSLGGSGYLRKDSTINFDWGTTDTADGPSRSAAAIHFNSLSSLQPQIGV